MKSNGNERAYTLGRNAYCDGLARDKNPNVPSTGSWEDWDLGWIETKECDPLEDAE